MTLLDLLQRKPPAEPKGARSVTFGHLVLDPKGVENQKREQRRHWREHNRKVRE